MRRDGRRRRRRDRGGRGRGDRREGVRLLPAHVSDEARDTRGDREEEQTDRRKDGRAAPPRTGAVGRDGRMRARRCRQRWRWGRGRFARARAHRAERQRGRRRGTRARGTGRRHRPQRLLWHDERSHLRRGRRQHRRWNGRHRRSRRDHQVWRRSLGRLLGVYDLGRARHALRQHVDALVHRERAIPRGERGRQRALRAGPGGPGGHHERRSPVVRRRCVQRRRRGGELSKLSRKQVCEHPLVLARRRFGHAARRIRLGKDVGRYIAREAVAQNVVDGIVERPWRDAGERGTEAKPVAHAPRRLHELRRLDEVVEERQRRRPCAAAGVRERMRIRGLEQRCEARDGRRRRLRERRVVARVARSVSGCGCRRGVACILHEIARGHRRRLPLADRARTRRPDARRTWREPARKSWTAIRSRGPANAADRRTRCRRHLR